MKAENEMTLTFPSRSSNESFARAAVACFAAQLDPNLEELIDFSATFQHFVREDRKVALFMAGLPGNVSALLSDKSVSFLRRAAQHQRGRIEDADITDAFR